MISVKEAEEIILSHCRSLGTEKISIENSLGRTLAENIYADRDMPPFNRATVDGFAVFSNDFSDNTNSFKITGTQAAGDRPFEREGKNDCVEIMTGAAVHPSFNAVIRYEDISIENGIALLKVDSVKPFQGIHKQAADQKKGDVILKAQTIIDPVSISILASVGKSEIEVYKLPKVAIISTGDELVDINETPSPFQIRRSNNYMLTAALKEMSIPSEMFHLKDDPGEINKMLIKIIENHDAIIVSGGISMGKFDHIPVCLKNLGANTLFHKVKQRPGKPLLFSTINEKVIFGLPGNPVSSFFCFIRYVLPWLKKCSGYQNNEPLFARLNRDISFEPDLDYFIPVKLKLDKEAMLIAEPFEGNGSGDFANLRSANAFMELPSEQNKFVKGNLYRIFPFKPNDPF